MSTIQFEASELADVAILCTGNTASDSGKRTLEHFCTALANYAKANAAAYAARYNEPGGIPPSPGAIHNAARGARFLSPERTGHAISTAGLLRYNLDECATLEALEACVAVLSSHSFQARAVDARRAEERRYTG